MGRDSLGVGLYVDTTAHFSSFRYSEDLCKLGKEYLNSLQVILFLDKIWKLLIYYTPFYH